MSAAPIRDGVYFNMPEAAYLAEERLSKSGIKALRISPADYWAQSYLNPEPPELTPEQVKRQEMAKLIGSAYHCAILEPEAYAARYVRELSPADFSGVEGFLSTGAAMGAELERRCLKKTGSVMEQARRLADNGFPEGKLWHLLMARWAQDRGDRIGIPATDWDQIAKDAALVQKVPAVAKLITGGAAEVSVFWTCPESGIGMKARFDYLRAEGWTELKSFANASGKHLFQCLTDAIKFNRYYIDAAAYLEAAEAIRLGGLDVVGPATDEEVELIVSIKERRSPLACDFIFQQKGAAPNVLHRRLRLFEQTGSEEAIAELEASGANAEHMERARRFQEVSDQVRHRTAIHEKARMEIRAAKRDWLAYSEIYERGEPWLPFNPSGEISDADFSLYFLEEVI